MMTDVDLSWADDVPPEIVALAKAKAKEPVVELDDSALTLLEVYQLPTFGERGKTVTTLLKADFFGPKSENKLVGLFVQRDQCDIMHVFVVYKDEDSDYCVDLHTLAKGRVLDFANGFDELARAHGADRYYADNLGAVLHIMSGGTVVHFVDAQLLQTLTLYRDENPPTRPFRSDLRTFTLEEYE